jgi:hypothetical protein
MVYFTTLSVDYFRLQDTTLSLQHEGMEGEHRYTAATKSGPRR